MDESTKEEAIQEEGFLTFNSFCLNNPDDEIVVRFQLMISTEFSLKAAQSSWENRIVQVPDHFTGK